MKNTFFLYCLLPLGAWAQHPDSAKVSPPRTAAPYQMSQQERQQIVDMAAEPGATFRNVRTFDGRYEGLRGTPYFLPAWSKGQIELTNGQRYTNVLIKFDAYRQELVLLRPQLRNDSIIIDRPRVNQFVLQPADNVSYVFRRYSGDRTNESGDHYFLVLYEQKSTLLKQVAKVITKANYKDPYSAGARYDAYDNEYAYYLLKPGQPLTKVKLSKKSLLDALSDKGKALKTFVDSHRLAIKSEADAVTLVQQYDSLQ